MAKHKPEINLSDHFGYSKLIRFTMPTIAMMIFTSIYGVVDGLFVSNVVGSGAFASVNLIMPAVMLPGTLGFMIGAGGSALISKTLGEGDNERANRYFSMFIYLEIILSLMVSVLGIVFMEPVARLLGASEAMVPDCVLYGRILMSGLVWMTLQYSFESLIITAERPKFGLIITVLSGVTNMALDFLFVYLFRWGVAGAGWASVISMALGSVIPLVFFSVKNGTALRLCKPQDIRFELKPIVKSLTNGASEMVIDLSMSLVNMLFNVQLMRFAGANGVSAFGVIMYAGFIFVGTFVGYSVGSAPIIGYHYGAENKAELKNLLGRSLRILGITAVVMTALAELTARPIAGLFVGYDSELLAISVNAVRIYSLGYILSWFNIFASSFFTALNNGLISGFLSFLRTFALQVAAILILPEFFGLDGIWYSVPLAELISVVVSILCLTANSRKYGYGFMTK